MLRPCFLPALPNHWLSMVGVLEPGLSCPIGTTPGTSSEQGLTPTSQGRPPFLPIPSHYCPLTGVRPASSQWPSPAPSPFVLHRNFSWYVSYSVNPFLVPASWRTWTDRTPNIKSVFKYGIHKKYIRIEKTGYKAIKNASILNTYTTESSFCFV